MTRNKKPSVSEDITNELDMLPDLIGYNLRMAQLFAYRNFARFVNNPKATPRQYTVLLITAANPGISQSRLGRMLGMDRATTMGVINKLQNRKWLIRKKSMNDRRMHALHLTAKGTAALKKLKSDVLKHENNLALTLSKKEKEQLINLLSKLRKKS